MSDNKIKILELFGGIGAATKALKNLNIACEYKYIDNDKNAVAAYNALNQSNFQPQNIKNFTPTKKYDIVIAGSPCQDFSQAGKNKKDLPQGRSLLYQEVLRIINVSQPDFFLFENVKALSKKYKIHYESIIRQLKGMGYFVFDKVLNALNFGIPQNRERVFILATKRPVNWVFVPQKYAPLSKFIDLKQLPKLTPPPKIVKEFANYVYFENQSMKNGSYNRAWKYDKYVGTLPVAVNIKVIHQQQIYLLDEFAYGRLMGFTQDDILLLKQNLKTDLKKLFGNSIVVPILENLFQQYMEKGVL